MTTLLFLGALSFVKAQVRIDSVLNTYSTNYQPERLYFQLDRSVYTPGDTVWFKGYIMAGIAPSNISKNLYVDFSDVNGKVLAHQVYPIVLGGSGGQFSIPDSLNGNSVHMRGYTVWMKNFDTTYFFDKEIRIVKKVAKVLPKSVPELKPVINFFPEGGNFVAGISSNIAFKANDQFGIPVEVEGAIYDSKNQKVTTIKSSHEGMGQFPIFPIAGETYTAKCKLGNISITQNLPAVQNAGIVLQLKAQTDKVSFMVSRSADIPEEQKEIHILATIHQEAVYMANIHLDQKTSIGGAIGIANLAAGIMQVTIFDRDWKPLAERIVFVDNLKDAVVTPEFGFIKIGLKRREDNEIVLQMPKGAIGNLSLAVTDAALGRDSSDNILTRFLITGELHGKIYHPEYYFSDTTPTIKNNLDLVMLTHGWRRYNWESITKGQYPQIKYPADTSYISLSGTVFGSTPALLRQAGDLIILATPVGKDVPKQMKPYIVSVRPDGTFSDPKAIFFDSLSVRYQFQNKKNFADQVSIRFMNNRLTPPLKIMPDKDALAYLKYSDTTGTAFLNFLMSEEEKLEALKKTATLEAVSVKARVKSPMQEMDEKYASGMFTGGNSQNFNLANDMVAQSSMNILQYLQGRVAGLQISNPTSTPSLQWRGGTPQIYLNEMPVDVQTIMNMPVTDMAYLKVFQPPFMGGIGGGSGGAIAIYTKRGDERTSDDTQTKTLPGKIIAGYSPIKEFYVPNYDRIDENNDKPDLRATLYWAPSILTDDQQNNFHIHFFNNDISKSFRAILEGLDSEGRFIHIEKVIE